MFDNSIPGCSVVVELKVFTTSFSGLRLHMCFCPMFTRAIQTLDGEERRAGAAGERGERVSREAAVRARVRRRRVAQQQRRARHQVARLCGTTCLQRKEKIERKKHNMYSGHYTSRRFFLHTY